jgi:hypothetical protein
MDPLKTRSLDHSISKAIQITIQDVGYYASCGLNLSKFCVCCTFELLISVSPHLKLTALSISLGGQPVKHRQEPNLNSWMLSMLFQVWVRVKKKNTRALAHLARPGSGFGRRARARNVHVNGPPKSGSNSCGKSAFFCRFVFCYGYKEPIVPHDRLSGLGRKSRLFPMVFSPVSGKGRVTCV